MTPDYAVCRLCGLDTGTRPNLNRHLDETHSITPALYRRILARVGSPEAAREAAEKIQEGRVHIESRRGIEVVRFDDDHPGGYL